MKLYKYIPTWAYGFDVEEFEINTKDELLDSDLCKEWVKRGYTISVKTSDVQEIEGGKIIAFKRISKNREDADFYVVATYKTYNDEVTLCKWLPIFEHLLYPKEFCTNQYDRPTEIAWSESELMKIKELEKKINEIKASKSE